MGVSFKIVDTAQRGELEALRHLAAGERPVDIEHGDPVVKGWRRYGQATSRWPRLTQGV